MAKTYTVTAERGSGDVWVLECAELRVVLQTQSLAHAADEMREVMAYQAEVSPDDLDIVVDIIFPPDIAEMKACADAQRQEAARWTTMAQESARDLAVAMKNAGMTVRDMGLILGVSYQRAHKLAAS